MKKLLALSLILSFVLILPGNAWAAIAFFQGTTCNGNTSPLSSTNFGSTVVAGDLIVVTTVDDGGTGSTITSITDTGSNTYTKVADSAGADTGTTQVWYTRVVTGGGSFHTSITWNTGSAARVSCAVQEFNGFTGTATFDKVSALANGTSVSPLSATSGTLTKANEVAVGSFGHYSTISAFSLGTGYTNLSTVNVANAASAQESQIVSVNTALTAGASIAASREWNAYVTTYYDLPSAAVGNTSSMAVNGSVSINGSASI